MKERVGTVYTMAPEVLQGEYTKQVHIRNVLRSSVAFTHSENYGFSISRKQRWQAGAAR